MTQSEECPSSSTTTLDDLNNGDRLQCSTRMQIFSGELLVVNRQEGIFVLRESKGTEQRQCNLHFVRFADLQSLKKLSSASLDERCHVPMDSSMTARRRLAKAEQRLGQLWVDSKPSEAARRTFIELKRIFDDVVWDGADIKVLKCVTITDPFDENGAECLDSRTSSIGTLARVKKILARRSPPSSARIVPPPAQCVSTVSPSSSTPSTLVQPEEMEELNLADCEFVAPALTTVPSPSSTVADDLFLDASQSEVPNAAHKRTDCASSPLRLSHCCSSSEELEMVTPPTID